MTPREVADRPPASGEPPLCEGHETPEPTTTAGKRLLERQHRIPFLHQAILDIEAEAATNGARVTLGAVRRRAREAEARATPPALDELRDLLTDALEVQRTGCDHSDIGKPGCRTCDPRVYPYHTALALADAYSALTATDLRRSEIEGFSSAVLDIGNLPDDES